MDYSAGFIRSQYSTKKTGNMPSKVCLSLTTFNQMRHQATQISPQSLPGAVSLQREKMRKWRTSQINISDQVDRGGGKGGQCLTCYEGSCCYCSSITWSLLSQEGVSYRFNLVTEKTGRGVGFPSSDNRSLRRIFNSVCNCLYYLIVHPRHRTPSKRLLGTVLMSRICDLNTVRRKRQIKIG